MKENKSVPSLVETVNLARQAKRDAEITIANGEYKIISELVRTHSHDLLKINWARLNQAIRRGDFKD